MQPNCEYCYPSYENQRLVVENEDCMFLMLNQPDIEGSGIIVPKQHRETVFDLTQAEWTATYRLIQQVKTYVDEHYRPDGYNIGWNCGAVGGQHVFHSHMHFIPRYANEPYAGKGIRYWFKSNGNRRPD